MTLDDHSDLEFIMRKSMIVYIKMRILKGIMKRANGKGFITIPFTNGEMNNIKIL